MLNENAKKWVAALRSGKYPQTKHFLNNGVGYCCLGVACELAIEDGVDIHKAESEYNGTKVIVYGDSAKTLSNPVLNWLGLRTRAGGYNFVDQIDEESLAGHNDAGKSFAEIANIIESEPEGLFEKVAA